jgi:hypothetical protein
LFPASIKSNRSTFSVKYLSNLFWAIPEIELQNKMNNIVVFIVSLF